MKNQIIKQVEESKIIAIIRGVSEDKLIPLTEALYRGGIRFVEVTFSANGKVSDEQTAQMIKMLVDQFDGKMYVGAGTVLTEKQVELTFKAGGKFIISPDVSEEVIKKTVELGMVSMPGALTPTEIRTAVRFGADFVKLFPIANFGASYVKAVRAPLSNVKMLAVGGVHDGNMEEFYKAGVCGFGIGTNITDKKMIENGDFDGIEKLAKKYVDLVNSF